jgi:uncharacterized protein (DUF1684 family)
VQHASSIVASFVLAGVLVGCNSSRTLTYEEEIAAWRTEKDRFMRDAPESPVIAAERAAFPALPYFPINPEYRVPAALSPTPDTEAIEMPLSTGQRRKMRRVGMLEFSLKGQPLKLTAFVEASDRTLRRLFVPFGDRTNGTETYPAGRYLDLDRTATGLYEIDFNRAYHPFCLFNPTFECPVPPRENRLDVPVRAGEKLATK